VSACYVASIDQGTASSRCLAFATNAPEGAAPTVPTPSQRFSVVLAV
jgi:glycerol kinase